MVTWKGASSNRILFFQQTCFTGMFVSFLVRFGKRCFCSNFCFWLVNKPLPTVLPPEIRPYDHGSLTNLVSLNKASLNSYFCRGVGWLAILCGIGTVGRLFTWFCCGGLSLEVWWCGKLLGYSFCMKGSLLFLPSQSPSLLFFLDFFRQLSNLMF